MTEPLIQAHGLAKHYSLSRSLFGRHGASLAAVDGIDLSLGQGRTLGIIGESGCGKSTLGRLLLGMEKPDAGRIVFQGEDLTLADRAQWRRLRHAMQMVFQDPYSALDRRIPVSRQIEEGLIAHGLGSPVERRARVQNMMARVGLSPKHASAYPHELSGGQRQRVVLARALALNPRFVVCDEPTSALDVSVQAQVINLMRDLQDELGVAYAFISHDLRVVRQVAHDIAILYLGRIVECGPAEQIYRQPRHPYTRALLASIPGAKQTARVLSLRGEVTNQAGLRRGCLLRARCPLAIARCEQERPVLRDAPMPGHQVACHVETA